MVAVLNRMTWAGLFELPLGRPIRGEGVGHLDI